MDAVMAPAETQPEPSIPNSSPLPLECNRATLEITMCLKLDASLLIVRKCSDFHVKLYLSLLPLAVNFLSHDT